VPSPGSSLPGGFAADGAYHSRVENSDLRRRYAPSCLIVLGLEPDRIKAASNSAAGMVHLELEDGTPLEKKAEARFKIRDALKSLDWSGKLTMVRVNSVQTGMFEDDVDVVAPARPGCIYMTKVQGPDEIRYADEYLGKTESKHGLEPGSLKIFAYIERIRALASVEAIASSSHRLIGLSVGATDLGAEVGYRRSFVGQELETLYAKSRVIVAAHLNGLIALDAPLISYDDPEGTYEQANWACRLGFDAKCCIFPYQVEIVNRAFGPSADEIKWAQRLQDVIDSGVMPDEEYGFVKRAKMILAEAKELR
jgi:citrate lyase subunit beta/citryl-CoA lyase